MRRHELYDTLKRNGSRGYTVERGEERKALSTITEVMVYVDSLVARPWRGYGRRGLRIESGMRVIVDIDEEGFRALNRP